MSRVPRFHVPDLPPSGPVPLPPEAARHARKTLRLEPGDPVRLFDGRGREAEARLLGGPRGGPVLAEILRLLPPPEGELPSRVLAFSPPRGERLEWLVEKSTELGATTLQPVLWERTPPRSRNLRLERLERIAASACEQCGRAFLPEILPPRTLEEFLEGPIPPGAFLLERGGPPPGREDKRAPILLAAGPEGGWTERERAALASRGFRPLGLGPLVLRIETALLAGLALLAPPCEAPGRGGSGAPP